MLRIEGIPGSVRGLRLVGELDLATAEKLKRAMDHNGLRGSGDVHLDLSAIEFIDSSGLRTIMQIADALSGQGQLVLDSPGQAVRRLLELTGITHFPNLVVAPAPPSPSSPSPSSPSPSSPSPSSPSPSSPSPSSLSPSSLSPSMPERL